jgi:phosphoglycolate phosphatase
VGWGIKRALEMVLPEGFADPQVFGQMLEEIHSRYFAQPAKYSYVYSGISRMVEDLAERGVPMIVYTNKDQTIAEAVMEQLFPDVTFSAVIGLSGVFPAKPDPGALLSHITGKNIPLSSILMVGDTPVDRDTAVNAGVDFAGVTWGYRTAAELRETGSQLNFDQPVDLHNWLVEEEQNEI